jgi:hypothetical protein
MADNRCAVKLARQETAEGFGDVLGTLMVLCLAAALIGMAGAIQAQSAAVQPVTLTANVDAYCTIDGAAASASRIVAVTTSNGKVATPGPLALTPSTSSKVICTSNAKIQLTTANGGLTNGPIPADASYTNKIHYTAKATYAGTTETLTTTDATPAGFQTTGRTTVSGAQTNTDLDISVDVLATPAGKFLVHGTYTDTIIVTLTPAT